MTSMPEPRVNRTPTASARTRQGHSDFGQSLLPTPILDSTPISAVIMTAKARELIDQVGELNTSVKANHSHALLNELSLRTQRENKKAPQEILAVLGDRGFSWRALAQLVNVTVPALQKWRRGEGVSGENRRKLAQLLACIDLISSQYKIHEIDSWFETPICDDIPVTPISIWAAGQYSLALRYAADELTSEETLSLFEPSWRSKWTSSFVAMRAGDGHVSLQMKE